MGKQQGIDAAFFAKIGGGLAVAAAPVVIWLLTGYIHLGILGVGVCGLLYAINALFSIGDYKNEWE